MKTILLITFSFTVLVWCGDTSEDKTSGSSNSLPYATISVSSLPTGGKTSQANMTLRVLAKNDISTHYAYKFLDGRVDCSTVSFTAYTPISDPIKINDTGNAGEKTICLSGRGNDANNNHVFQQHPTQITFLKVNDIEASDSVRVISRGIPQVSCNDTITANIDVDTGSKATAFKWCLIKNRITDTCLSCRYSDQFALAEHGTIRLTNLGNTGEKELCLRGVSGTDEQFPASSYVWQKTDTGTATINTVINQYDPSNEQTIKVDGSCSVTHYRYYYHEHKEYHVPCPDPELFSYQRSVREDLVFPDVVNNAGLYKTLCIVGTDSRGNINQPIPNRLAW
ncbi:MAG: hypothetical protein OYH77_07320, partial [Pseudomonadota bacterium]|nr:hypothetical protein [Pseudomonadota bacterium]